MADLKTGPESDPPHRSAKAVKILHFYRISAEVRPLPSCSPSELLPLPLFPFSLLPFRLFQCHCTLQLLFPPTDRLISCLYRFHLLLQRSYLLLHRTLLRTLLFPLRFQPGDITFQHLLVYFQLMDMRQPLLFQFFPGLLRIFFRFCSSSCNAFDN